MDPLSPSSPVSSASTLQLGTQISTAVASKTLQAQRQQGAAVLQLIQAAGDVQNASLAGDPLVAKATGLGGRLDVRA